MILLLNYMLCVNSEMIVVNWTRGEGVFTRIKSLAGSNFSTASQSVDTLGTNQETATFRGYAAMIAGNLQNSQNSSTEYLFCRIFITIHTNQVEQNSVSSR